MAASPTGSISHATEPVAARERRGAVRREPAPCPEAAARVADAAAAVVGTRAGGSGHGFDATQGRAAVADTDEARRRTGYIPDAFDRIGSGLAAGDAATRRATGRRLHGGSRHRAV